MIKTYEAVEIDGSTVPRHTVEIFCPACNRDVDEQELAVLKCNYCGQGLSEPLQNVAIHTTTVPAAIGFTMG